MANLTEKTPQACHQFLTQMTRLSSILFSVLKEIKYISRWQQ